MRSTIFICDVDCGDCLNFSRLTFATTTAGIRTKLRNANSAVNAITEGDLSAEIKASGNDEVSSCSFQLVRCDKIVEVIYEPSD